MAASFRVAVGSIFTECNDFGGEPITLESFKRYEWRYGADVLQLRSGVVGGMLQTLEVHSCNIVPLMVASTCPGGRLTADCYSKLKEDLLTALLDVGSVDGVLLALHGAALVEDIGDLEGDLLEAVRKVIGEKIPLVATLDLHAHVSARMVTNADALVAWETYPHQDTFTTGERGARLMVQILEGKVRPTMAWARVPVVTGAILGGTEAGPFADLMRFAKGYENTGSIVSTNVFLVHPNLDVPDMGSGGLVITNNDPERAVSLATEIAERYWARRFDLEPELFTPTEAIARGIDSGLQPLLLVEMADCAGGGAAGDSVHTLRALLEAPLTGLAYAPVVDPQAAMQCHHAGQGATVDLQLGHHLDPKWGEPLSLTGTVVTLSDGKFRYTGGIWAGTESSMGPTAVVQVGQVRILITSNATYDWADEQFQSVGLDPRAAQFLVVKNPMNYQFGYAGVAAGRYFLDTPGPTPASIKGLPFKNLQRPCFPWDRDIPGLQPTVVESVRRF